MNISDVRRRLRKIEAMQHDYEAAHSEEDALYGDVLRAIAKGADRALASEALKTQNLTFPRYCA